MDSGNTKACIQISTIPSPSLSPPESLRVRDQTVLGGYFCGITGNSKVLQLICPKRRRLPYIHFNAQHYSQFTNRSNSAPTGMNAAAYLTNQGWRGEGHALHHSGRGITKPIHVPQKANVLGVGKKKHDAHADQWWARAFDDMLKGLNAPKDEATEKTEGVALGSDAPALQVVGIGGPKWVGQGSLYSNFVRGESLSGTLTPEEKDQLETKSELGDESGCAMGNNDVNPISATAKDIVKSKTKRRQQVEVIAEYSNLGAFAAVKIEPRDVRMEESKQNVREIMRDTETNEQRRQRKREKARRALESAESRTLPGQPREIASKNSLTSDRLVRRSKDHPRTAGNAHSVATVLRKASRDETRERESEKR